MRLRENLHSLFITGPPPRAIHRLRALSHSCFSLSIASMSKGPGLYSDIGKKAKDLLTKDYISDQKFSVSTCSDTGVAITSTAVKKGELSISDVAAQYKYKNTLIDVKLDTESNISTTLTITDIVPSTKTIASFKLPDYNSGKLEVQYFHHHATFTTAVALNQQSPTVDLTATVGTPKIAFGAEAGYKTASGEFTKYNVGISVTKPDTYAAIFLTDRGDIVRASFVHHLDQLKKSAAVGEITRKFSKNMNTFTVGGLYAFDDLTVVKAKLNNQGTLGAVLQHELFPKSVLTVSTEFDTKALDQTPRFGLALALKP
ncbi:voltage dependent anion channel 2 [Actinidia rufa]|uniref:Voltage-dependent anion-selective channel protein n=1 Tax=Actinidia rufa TaxID=165716 RepID=A0A7J0E3G9_9ERIC|nr:voltage dependent anion channel 2 [Actinidia rufa]